MRATLSLPGFEAISDQEAEDTAYQGDKMLRILACCKKEQPAQSPVSGATPLLLSIPIDCIVCDLFIKLAAQAPGQNQK